MKNLNRVPIKHWDHPCSGDVEYLLIKTSDSKRSGLQTRSETLPFALKPEIDITSYSIKNCSGCFKMTVAW